MAPLLRIPPEALDEYRILTQVLGEIFETRAQRARLAGMPTIFPQRDRPVASARLAAK